jgi:hypothetical protein
MDATSEDALLKAGIMKTQGLVCASRSTGVQFLYVRSLP